MKFAFASFEAKLGKKRFLATCAIEFEKDDGAAVSKK
jgi:hypothetical protein